MKRYNDLFKKITSFENLYEASRETARGRRFRSDVLLFNQYLEQNLFDMQRELRTHTYRHGEYDVFYVYDPKVRRIMNASYRDKVIQRAVHNVLEPIFDRMFITNSFACRKGKGVDKGVETVERYLRQERGTSLYCLKCDIAKYFDNIDHDVLKSLFARKIKCRDTLWLLGEIIDSAGSTGKGIPVGNITSQLSANLYLTPLDYFIKQEKRIRYYVRYMDDFVILHHDKNLLRSLLEEVRGFLKDTLRLELNAKTAIFPVRHGIDFLGYRIFTDKRLLRKRYVKRIKRMMRHFEREFAAGRLSREYIRQVLASWNGRSRYADTPYLKAYMDTKAELLFGISF